MTRNVPIAILLMLLPAAWAEVEWTAPITINASTAEVDTNKDRIDVVTDGQGTWLSVWSEQDFSISTEWDIVFGSISIDNGETWSERFVIAAPGGRWVRAVYSDGVWGVSFYTWGNGLPYAIYFVRSTDLGHWTDPNQVAPQAPTSIIVATEVELRAVGSTWIICWEQEPRESADVDAWYVRSEDGGINWSEPALLGPWFAQEGGVDRAPTVCGREDGVWVCVWRSTGTLSGYDLGVDGDLFFARSTDGGQTWSQPMVVDPEYSVLDNDSWDPPYQLDQMSPTLSTDGHVFLLVFIEVGRMGYSVSKNGLDWTPYAFLGIETDNPNDQPAVSDGRGNWFVVFQSMYGVWGGPLELSAVGEDLHLEWGNVREIAFAEEYESISPRVATDGTGNWILTWMSRRHAWLPLRVDRIQPKGAVTAETMTNLKSASLGVSAQMTGVFHWRAME